MRECGLTIVTGAKGSGKTYKTIRDLEIYASKRPVLIFDVNEEDMFSNYRTVDFDVRAKDLRAAGAEVSKIKMPGIYRIIPMRKDGNPMTTNELQDALLGILFNYRSGALLIEDINKYVGQNVHKDILGTIVTQRHKGLDIVAHYQSVNRPTPMLWPNVNYLRLHKEGSELGSNMKDRLVGCYELVYIMKIIIDQHFRNGNPYCSAFIDVQKSKLLGFNDNGKHRNITIDEIKTGVDQYLIDNRSIRKRQEEYNKIKNLPTDFEAIKEAFINSKSYYFL